VQFWCAVKKDCRKRTPFIYLFICPIRRTPKCLGHIYHTLKTLSREIREDCGLWRDSAVTGGRERGWPGAIFELFLGNRCKSLYFGLLIPGRGRGRGLDWKNKERNGGFKKTYPIKTLPELYIKSLVFLMFFLYNIYCCRQKMDGKEEYLYWLAFLYILLFYYE
jgi:hypothetical protein